MPEIEPFPIHIPDSELTALRARLAVTRLPDRETVADTGQGVQLERLTAVLKAWEQHDWRALERRWNALGHFRTQVDGLNIAYWHVRSAEPNAVPLVLTHGWPGSVLEFEKLIGPLTDPVAHGGSADDAFHVVVPSLPGFGFTERPAEPGWHPGRTAAAWAELMAVLGYLRFGAHGGDWGAFVSTELARREPDRVLALHLTMPIVSPLPEDRASADEAEAARIRQRDHFLYSAGTHALVQGARPQTLGYSLVDSPSGLAAWLGERLDAFADTRPEAGGGISLAQQVDNIALYWFTQTGASSVRWYWDAQRWTPNTAEAQNQQPVDVPTYCTVFPYEPFPVVRRWAERRYRNLVSWHEPPFGGHFSGWEQPDVLVAEIRDAFRTARKTSLS
ncbi:alpha/beta fold hydrolase [Kineosporia sp. J2-2]|uniref:Alpha/beta fold hydrolase n=1 Tax=Kineosporia corallincola TaxID=2835133 RepID=A0ABS5TIK3_9ACTN|nr:epoxide hydrolase family protein [Kineosporia corallincola]MBT0769903.1 alpha/beta fold hydrolase [Kineosporia corallincola]